jgi:hypothetical protein
MDSPGMQQCRDRVDGTLQRGKYGTGEFRGQSNHRIVD